jgi:hypothetical protein
MLPGNLVAGRTSAASFFDDFSSTDLSKRYDFLYSDANDQYKPGLYVSVGTLRQYTGQGAYGSSSFITAKIKRTSNKFFVSANVVYTGNNAYPMQIGYVYDNTRYIGVYIDATYRVLMQIGHNGTFDTVLCGSSDASFYVRAEFDMIAKTVSVFGPNNVLLKTISIPSDMPVNSYKTGIFRTAAATGTNYIDNFSTGDL